MFKSAFSKYLTAFIIIILLSFLMLSGIITSMIRTYATEEKESELASTSTVISHFIATNGAINGGINGIEDLETYISTGVVSRVIYPIINRDKILNIIIVDDKGEVLLSTLGTENDHERVPFITGELGKVDMKLFNPKTGDDSQAYLSCRGNLGGFIETRAIACAKEIVTQGVLRGYVVTLESTSNEEGLISITNRAVLTSSAWVMLAAVIAVYFITERLIHPLRNMTSATKKFAKGDFASRVSVSGEDEVAELGRAFNNMAESLEKSEKMRSSFLASVSHDLRTPMTTISGFIEGITSGAIPEEKHEYYLGIISAEVHRLSRLVSQLLDISRIESGDRKFDFSDFDIAEMARIILISFEQKIDDKRLDVEFEAESDEMYAFADKDAIYQVLYNLCHNAIKFSKEGGKFRISIKKTDVKKLSVSVFNEGETIAKEDLGLIFERFYKTDKSRGLDKNGVGLGLYICKTIIDAHDEQINVSSSENHGTEFSFTVKEGENVKRRSI